MSEVGGEEADQFEKMNQRAMWLISSTISQNLCSVYSMHNTPYSLRTALENKCEGTQDQRTNRTLREFFGITYDKVRTISEFIVRLNEKLGRVAETGQVRNESLKVCIFTLVLQSTHYFRRADTWSIAHPNGKLNELMNTVLQQDPQERSGRNVAYAATSRKRSESNLQFLQEIRTSEERLLETKEQREEDKEGKENRKKPQNMMAIASSVPTDSWILDTGASIHMSSSKENLNEFFMFPKPKDILIANNSKIHASGRGKYCFKLNGEEYVLLEVYWIPSLAANLFSVTTANEHGFDFRIDFKKKEKRDSIKEWERYISRKERDRQQCITY